MVNFHAPAIHVLTRRASRSMGDGELTHMERAIVDPTAADDQHAAYRAAIVAAGADLIDLAPLHDYPDSTFVEDVLIARPEVFVLCRPGARSRQGEVEELERHLPEDRRVVRITEPATLDGGDVLVIDRAVYVGLSTRTNLAAASQLLDVLSPFGYTVQNVELGCALHLKTAVTSPSEGLVVLNPQWIDPNAFRVFDIVEVHPDEPFAGNTLRVKDAQFVQAAHPRTAERLRARGVAAEPLDISEFAKAEAGLTCMSVCIPPPST